MSTLEDMLDDQGLELSSLQEEYGARAKEGYWVPEGEDVLEILFTDMTIPHLNNAVVVIDSIEEVMCTRLLCRPYLVAELKRRGVEKC